MKIWPVREATHGDWPEIHMFFLDLDATSRYMYFGTHVSDEVINNTWKRFENRDGDQFFVVEHHGEVVGVCQVFKENGVAEIAVVVKPEYRQQGIAYALLERAVGWCKTHGVQDLMMFCLPGNNVVQKIMQKYKLLPLMRSAPAEARFKVPEPRCQDWYQEIWNRYINWLLTASKMVFASVTK